jgi:alpha-L-fucosidase
MKKKYFIFMGLVAIITAGVIVRCNIETASGPTPYSVFDGNATSSSSVSIGNGVKSFLIPAGLVMNNIGKDVTVRPTSGDTTMLMSGTIISYDRNTGSLTINVVSFAGSGTLSGWKIVGGKTATALDSAKQAYADLKFGMFYHFNMSTFDRCCCARCLSVSGEWGLQNRDPKLFNPTKLNCGQWADAAKSAGCKYMVLVTKHHDGFCLWPSKLTNYSVASASCTTDVVRQFVDSAQSRGMKVGFYYSMRDLTNGYDLNFVKGQLTELLTNYGDIICLWFDGWGWDVGYKNVPYDTIWNLIHTIQPKCMLIENNREYNTKHSDIPEWEQPVGGPPPLNNTMPAEGNEPINYNATKVERCWFWHPDIDCELMTAQMIVDNLKHNNKGNAAYLLDLTPDTLGLVPQCQVDRMKEVGTMLGVGTPASYTGR